VPAMGGNVHLVVVLDGAAQDGRIGSAPRALTGERLLDAAAARLTQLERRWSRFVDDSEICRLGRSAGPLEVSADTRLLVAWCVTAFRRSRGRFDAGVLAALEKQGYDRSFDEVLERSPAATPAPIPAAGKPLRGPGCDEIVIDDDAGTVTLPAGLRLDPGGIAKGLAADLVTAELLASGAAGACVNVAGDLRARGLGPADGGGRWLVGVEHPTRVDRPLAMIPLPPGGGAVASSSVLSRRWGGGRHHVIDPGLGRPANSDVVAATVVADDGVWADAATKIALVPAGRRQAIAELDRLDVAALLVCRDGTVIPTAAFPPSSARA